LIPVSCSNFLGVENGARQSLVTSGEIVRERIGNEAKSIENDLVDPGKHFWFANDPHAHAFSPQFSRQKGLSGYFRLILQEKNNIITFAFLS
jgi:hypothetical protein